MKNINITEASGLSSYDKMKAFDEYIKTGSGRRENIKACGDQKLLDFYDICVLNNFDYARRAIEPELVNRGYNNVVQKAHAMIAMKTNSTNTTNTQQTAKAPSEAEKLLQQGLLVYSGGITKNDIDASALKKMKENYDNGIFLKKSALEAFGVSQNTIKVLIIYLLFSIILKINENITAIKDYFTSIGITNDQIKELIKDVIANKEVIARLNNIANDTEEIEKSATLEEICDAIDINAPLYRGAPQPPFDEYKVNESKMPDEMRAKAVKFIVEKNSTESIIFVD